MNVGRAVKIIRARQAISQHELAERAALSDVYVGYIEQGRRQATVDTLNKIAAALNTTASAILAEAETL